MLFLQIINVILGSGLLGLPAVMAQNGIGPGLGILTGVCLLTYFTGMAMIGSLPDERRHSLTAHVRARIARLWLRNACVAAIVAGIVTQELGALISYVFVLISDLEPAHPVAVGCGVFVLLLWVTSIDLTGVSGFSVLAMILFLGYKMAFVAMPDRIACRPEETNATGNRSDGDRGLIVWRSVSTCVFATVCHTTLGSLACAHGVRRTQIHFTVGLLAVFALYVATAVCDVFTFPRVADNILVSFRQCVPGAWVLIWVYKASIVTTIPTIFVSVCGEFPSTEPSIVRSLGLLVSLAAAHSVASLGWILAGAGFTAGIINIFVVPAIIYLSNT